MAGLYHTASAEAEFNKTQTEGSLVKDRGRSIGLHGKRPGMERRMGLKSVSMAKRFDNMKLCSSQE